MLSRPKILIVEDTKSMSDLYVYKLSPHFDVLVAATVYDANRIFQDNNGDFELIIFDYQVPSRPDSGLLSPGDNTECIVQKIKRDGFTKPMIATSSEPKYRTKLMNAGCTHESEKLKAAEMTLDLLFCESGPRTL